MNQFRNKLLRAVFYVTLLINLILVGEIAAYWINYEFVNYRQDPQYQVDWTIYFLAFVALIISIASLFGLFIRRPWAYISLIFGVIFWVVYLYAMIAVELNEYPKQKILNHVVWIVPFMFNILGFYALIKIEKFGKQSHDRN